MTAAAGEMVATDGVVAIYKPSGMTSFDAVRSVRRTLNQRKVGHAGTLDPAASGVLPICVGRATRLVDYFHQQSKEYRCTIRIGETSPTLDVESEVVTQGDATSLTREQLEDAVTGFVGEIDQMPPMHSAVRHEGQRLYEIARQGKSVERVARPVTIYAIDVETFTPGAIVEVTLRVECGKGMYVRSLASDLAAVFECGGILSWLERTRYGTLSVSDCVTPDELAALPHPYSALRSAECAVAGLARVELAPQLVRQLMVGQSVWIPGPAAEQPTGEVRICDIEGRLIGIGEVRAGLLRPTKVMADQ